MAECLQEMKQAGHNPEGNAPAHLTGAPGFADVTKRIKTTISFSYKGLGDSMSTPGGYCETGGRTKD